ncbi:aminotransferase class I/II-fold pyridoxal phosphate-dependent enzyme [Kaistia dalseonensis]|uniref:aspartate transaminase n=1 Tax=Kaistia dalseonensis TaxID=410840 RepID=A0ABU0H219_9HYPH|nr:aminotransferase class I/II-fold pyridoxal phosphate-dependent enzyme [Kaistia dalseonensis]MCX5493532.1 aminotransferase class I/II-fold pyridoxal phosphate-dependent enzyme [Kaistia dalseonensis]MDQ0436092.1 aspartate/methionine/tyrosine aminotransferase [Kaistia dalseonensis]
MTSAERPPSRRSAVAPFIAMDVLSAARDLEAHGHHVVHMELGEPGATAPRAVLDAARAALDEGRIGYTEALGSRALRQRIAQYYADTHGITVSPARIAITTGSSAGFNLTFLAAFDPGDRVAIAAPGYPAYRNILGALGLEVVEIETTAETRHAITPAMLEAVHREKPLAGLLVASPANPTGTMMTPEALRALVIAADDLGIRFISDEIYHGLVYDGVAETALRVSDRAIVINSFSKYYCMTGWRIGWMVLPESLVRPIERLGQSLYISAPDLSQRAAIAAFDATEDLEVIKAGYAANRRVLLDHLPAIGFEDIFPVDGAFYVYASVRRFSNDSAEFARRMLHEAGIAATPGGDFDQRQGHGYIRFSFAGAGSEIVDAVARLKGWLA